MSITINADAKISNAFVVMGSQGDIGPIVEVAKILKQRGEMVGLISHIDLCQKYKELFDWTISTQMQSYEIMIRTIDALGLGIITLSKLNNF